MSKTLTEVSHDAAELPVNDKLALARILLDLADRTPESADEVEEVWDEEIQKRIAELRSGKARGIPLAQVRAKIEKQLRK